MSNRVVDDEEPTRPALSKFDVNDSVGDGFGNSPNAGRLGSSTYEGLVTVGLDEGGRPILARISDVCDVCVSICGSVPVDGSPIVRVGTWSPSARRVGASRTNPPDVVGHNRD